MDTTKSSVTDMFKTLQCTPLSTCLACFVLVVFKFWPGNFTKCVFSGGGEPSEDGAGEDAAADGVADATNQLQQQKLSDAEEGEEGETSYANSSYMIYYVHTIN